MIRITYTDETSTNIEICLLDLAVNESLQIETGVGIITVRRTPHGAEGWLRSFVIPDREFGVRSPNALEALIQLMEIGQQYSAKYCSAGDRDDWTQETTNPMTPLAPLLISRARERLRDHLPDVSLLSASFDKTLFVTDTKGSINRQTLHYPLEKEYAYAACDCLRFRCTLRLCEHLLVVIAEEKVLTETFELMEAAA